MVLESQNDSKYWLLKVNSDSCYNAVISSLTTHLSVKINGSLTSEEFFTQLVCLATNRESIHSASKLYPGFRGETSLRHHLRKFDMDSLVAASSNLLLSHVLKHIKPGKKYRCAIDFTGDPYYGVIDDKNEKYILKGQRKKSTYKFYTYATLAIIEKNEKFTLAVVPVERKETRVNSVRSLINVLEIHRIVPEVICMDSGFYSVDVMNLLKEKDIPFILPVPTREGWLKHKVNSLKKEEKFKYEVGGMKKANRAKIIVGVKIMRLKEGEKRVKDRAVFAISGVVVNWSMKKIEQVYAHRFSIESSYRIRNEVKPKTSTKNATIRYLFTLISFLIENIWVSFQITFFTKRQRGQMVIEEDKFRLSMFLKLVNRKIREILEEITEVEIIWVREERW